MNIDEAKSLLKNAGYSTEGEERLGNGTGTKLKLRSGQIVNVFDNGSWSVQGKNPEDIKALFGKHSGGPANGMKNNGSREVFVVYGHDQGARTELEAMLLRWELKPMFLDQLPSEGQTLIEKLEKYQASAQFAVVLATPDDEGHRAAHPDEKSYRVRQNVVLELGMLLALLGRSRVAILLKDQVNTERPSDIHGLIYIPFKEHVQEAALPLAKEMNSQGLTIDLKRL